MNDDLAAFIEHARERGMDHATIRMLLRSAGWKEKEIFETLAKTSLEMPVPPPPDRGGAREAFFHLLTFAAFYASVIAVVVVLFRCVNHWFPDPAAIMERFGTARLSTIRWPLAFVIVSFPVFLWLSRSLLREMRANPERSWSATRRWLTYVTLFFAAIALGGDVITLVFRLLEGELTARFLLKVVLVLVIAGLTFGYYTLSLRMHVGRRETTIMHRAFAGGACVLVLIAVVCGFVLAGSPVTARLQRFDDRRVSDLQSIHDAIETACLGNSRFSSEGPELQRPLPETLEQAADLAEILRPEIVDPETGEPYGYEVLGDGRFRLCAAFRFPRDDAFAPPWNHPAGRHCFEFDLLEP